MKRTSTLTSALLASLLLVGLLLPALAPRAPAAPGASVQEGDVSTFAGWKKEFQRAMKINSKQHMVQLVRRHNDMAVGWVVRTCEQISEQSSEELEDFAAALGEAWQTSMKTDFVKIVYEYFSLMDPAIRRERSKLIVEQKKASSRFDQNREKKDGPIFVLLSHQFEGLARSFEELGDHFYASETWSLYGQCYDKFMRRQDADLFKACAGYRAMLENRDAIQLKDRDYEDIEPLFKKLDGQGYGLSAEESAAKGGPGAGVTSEQPYTRLELTFEMIPTVDAYERPNYACDTLYPIWTSLSLKGKGSSAKFPSMETSPVVMRLGANDVRVDADGDGEGETRIPLTGKIVPIETTIGSGDEARDWGFLAVTGTTQDTYNGIQFNLAPDDNQMTLYVVSAASMVGDMGGITLRIIDENMDGIYGSPPRTWGYLGLTKNQHQPEMDSIVIGDSKRARPWSEFQQIGDEWYHFARTEDGLGIETTPVGIETGKIQYTYKGGKPSWLIVRGVGKWAETYIDIADGKPHDVPEGYYKLYYGEVRKGKKQQAAKALILPGLETTWEVKVGETTKFALGAPFKFVFEFDADEEAITVSGQSVAIVGVAGERYERIWNSSPRPLVSFRKAGARKGSKGKKMKRAGSQEEITENGWAVAWFPYDLTIENKNKNKKKVEVQLIEKKNKLFGKVESDWKGN